MTPGSHPAMNGLGQVALHGALGGLAGAAIMTAGEKLERWLTGRPSPVGRAFPARDLKGFA